MMYDVLKGESSFYSTVQEKASTTHREPEQVQKKERLPTFKKGKRIIFRKKNTTTNTIHTVSYNTKHLCIQPSLRGDDENRQRVVTVCAFTYLRCAALKKRGTKGKECTCKAHHVVSTRSPNVGRGTRFALFLQTDLCRALQ